MPRARARFDSQDLREELPPPGYYAARVAAARYGRSTSGNFMIQVTYALGGGAESFSGLSEYFVLEGPSPHAIAVCRRRLVELYRAAGRAPSAGDEIVPADLVGAHLEVRVEHDSYLGRPRLRVAAHRPPSGEDGGGPF